MTSGAMLIGRCEPLDGMAEIVNRWQGLRGHTPSYQLSRTFADALKDSHSIMDADKYVLVKCVFTETTVEFGPAPQSAVDRL